MSVILGILAEEKERNERHKLNYLKELEQLPKGSIRKREKNGHAYYYLVYRKDGKIINQYIGKEGPKLESYREKLSKRHRYEAIVKNINSELKIIGKILK